MARTTGTTPTTGTTGTTPTTGTTQPPRRHTVAAVIADGAAPFELAIACEVFGIDRSELGVPWYRFMVVATEPRPIRTKTGFTIDTPYRLADLEEADTIVVPVWNDEDVDPPAALLDALRTAHARGARLLSVCTGAFVLAAAGLLDGRRATTHWMWTEKLAARYPEVNVEPGVLYVDEGDVLTSAGTAAGIDLCLHVVRKDFGAEIANAVARRMVVPPHRDGGQAQYIDDPVPPCPGDDPFAATMAWMVEHLDRQVTVEDLAERSAMSPRTFARRFRATTGTTPLQWILRQRVLLAQRLLETTDEPIERIADLCGFGTAAGLRQHFARSVRTTPQAYRRTFRRQAG
jgi:transcriptional regulator GlxA family with amidase domain